LGKLGFFDAGGSLWPNREKNLSLKKFLPIFPFCSQKFLSIILVYPQQILMVIKINRVVFFLTLKSVKIIFFHEYFSFHLLKQFFWIMAKFYNRRIEGIWPQNALVVSPPFPNTGKNLEIQKDKTNLRDSEPWRSLLRNFFSRLKNGFVLSKSFSPDVREWFKESFFEKGSLYQETFNENESKLVIIYQADKLFSRKCSISGRLNIGGWALKNPLEEKILFVFRTQGVN